MCQVAHKFSRDCGNECSHVLLHLELWIHFSFQLHTMAEFDTFSEEYAP